MMRKKALLQKLNKSIKDEDDFLAEYKPTLIHEVQETVGLSEKEKEIVIKVLKTLLSDTQRHRETVAKLIEQVEKSAKDVL